MTDRRNPIQEKMPCSRLRVSCTQISETGWALMNHVGRVANRALIVFDPWGGVGEATIENHERTRKNTNQGETITYTSSTPLTLISPAQLGKIESRTSSLMAQTGKGPKIYMLRPPRGPATNFFLKGQNKIGKWVTGCKRTNSGMGIKKIQLPRVI